jgi:hypothetical protein
VCGGLVLTCCSELGDRLCLCRCMVHGLQRTSIGVGTNSLFRRLLPLISRVSLPTPLSALPSLCLGVIGQKRLHLTNANNHRTISLYLGLIWSPIQSTRLLFPFLSVGRFHSSLIAGTKEIPGRASAPGIGFIVLRSVLNWIHKRIYFCSSRLLFLWFLCTCMLIWTCADGSLEREAWAGGIRS